MSKNRYHANTTPTIDEVHLRQLTVDEALLKLDKYLNDAFMAGFYQVRVIHGKGTGTLKLEVSRELSRHSLVESFRKAEPWQGGDGAMIVQLVNK